MREKVTGLYLLDNENLYGENFRCILIQYASLALHLLRDDYIVNQDGDPAISGAIITVRGITIGKKR